MAAGWKWGDVSGRAGFGIVGVMPWKPKTADEGQCRYALPSRQRLEGPGSS